MVHEILYSSGQFSFNWGPQFTSSSGEDSHDIYKLLQIHQGGISSGDDEYLIITEFEWVVPSLRELVGVV